MDDSSKKHAPERTLDSDTLESDRPIELIPKNVLEYRPRVRDPPDLFVDLSVGVVLGRSNSFHRKYRNTGLGMIGAIVETSDDILTSLLGMPVNLDLVSPHVIFVSGKRGSGKSYTLGILVEEIASAMERKEIEVATVVIDTVDVFRQAVEPNVDQEALLKKWNLQSRGFPVAVFIPLKTYNSLPEEVRTKARLHPLAISPRELTVSDWGYVLEKGGQLSTSMENLMGDLLESISRGYALESGEYIALKRSFSIRDMVQCIESNPSITELYQASTRTAMIQRLKRAARLGVFHPSGTSAQDLAVAGQTTIIDVAPLGSDAEVVLAILTNMLCRQVLTYRMAWTEEGTSAREELPPTWLIIDEAHTLVPKGSATPAKDAIVGYAKLGRRFGCSLVLCTQQPSAVADAAISQADIIISHSLSHDSDIRALQQRAPAVMPDMFRDKVFISSLPRGVALVFDQSTENKRGFITQIRPRLSQHGGTDRLSSLFEAARLMIPEGIQEKSNLQWDLEEIAAEPAGELTEGLSEIPRPPLKLSKEDWNTLDDWIQEYIRVLFERERLEFSITDEPAPRAAEPTTEQEPEAMPHVIEPSMASVDTQVIDSSKVRVRQFGPLSPSVLLKAITRKILYSKQSHRYLFTTGPFYRDTIPVQIQGITPSDLVEWLASGLVSAGLTIEKLEDDDDITFVMFSKNGVRGVFATGVSGSIVCSPVVIVGNNRALVVQMVDKVRRAMS